MRLPGRFEWKILGVVMLVAGLSVGTAAYALQYTLLRLAAFSVRHQRDIGGSSARAADVFRAYFAERKAEFHRQAEEIVASQPTSMAHLSGVEGLLRARLQDGERILDEWQAPPDLITRLRESPPIIVALPGGGIPGEPPRVLSLTFGIPQEVYEDFVRLRDAIDRERELDRAYGVLVPQFLRDYFLLVFSILIVAPFLGLAVARRVTKRMARLRDAARLVGQGDLSVRIAPKGKDELDELGRTFDRMVAELGEARSRLEYLQKVSAWQEVARRLAHEIKNPLTPIQLAVQEVASKYAGDDPAYRRLLDTAVEILHEEIGGLRRLVDDFSAFAKLQRMEPATLDIGALVSEFARLHPEWQPFVTAAVPTDMVTAPCDRALFRRVLANLVENGVQAARGVGKIPVVRLAVEERPELRRVRIIVDDNGPGIPAADRQRIFDPYVTHKEGGTGLGLAIVRKIVIDHGGDVTVADTPSPQGGARFVVEIPT